MHNLKKLGISLFDRLKTAATSQTSLYGASSNKGEERRVKQRYISDIVRGPLSSALCIFNIELRICLSSFPVAALMHVGTRLVPWSIPKYPTWHIDKGPGLSMSLSVCLSVCLSLSFSLSGEVLTWSIDAVAPYRGFKIYDHCFLDDG